MGKAQNFLNSWMLPLAMILGITSYLALYFIQPLATHVEPGFSKFAKDIQPIVVAIMLFLQFNRISPHDLKFTKWHFILLGFQIVMFVVLALICTVIPHGNLRILLECAMLCFVCPTAAAAGVITRKLGGSLAETVTYVVMINIVAAFIIPLMIPIVHPSADTTFWRSFLAICMHVFPLLVLPLLLAWLIRYTIKPLQHWLIRLTDWAFYFWGISLTFAMYLATRALINSGISIWIAILIGIVSLTCCLIQFITGRRSGHLTDSGNGSDTITAGQALGQKNTGFLIWLGYSFMTPVTSVAGGLYAIWQNLINSWELHEASKATQDAPGQKPSLSRQ